MRRILSDLLCFCGGANLSVLRQCPTERGKYHTLGLMVINTTIMASVAMNFAVHAIYPNDVDSADRPSEWALWLFSAFWGIIIFGIDWGLIKTIRKHASPTLQQRLETWIMGAFRLAVAVLISFVISRPLETVIFKSYLPAERLKQQYEFEDQLTRAYQDSLAAAARQTRADQEAKIAQIKAIEAGPNSPEYFESIRRDSIARATYEATQAANSEKINATMAGAREELRIVDRINKQIQARSGDRSERSAALKEKQVAKARLDSEIASIRNDPSSYAIADDSVGTRSLTSQAVRSIADRQEQQAGLDREIITIQQELKDIDEAITDLKQERSPYTAQANAATNRVRALQQEIQAKKQEVDSATKVVSAVKDTFAIRQATILEIQEQRIAASDSVEQQRRILRDKRSALADSIAAKSYAYSLISDLKALEGLSQSETDGDWVWWVRTLVLLLIILIDTAPILIKLISKRGPYDELLEEEEDRRSFLSRQETYSNKHVIRELALAQRDVLNAAISQWKDQEIRRTDLAENHINTERPPRA